MFILNEWEIECTAAVSVDVYTTTRARHITSHESIAWRVARVSSTRVVCDVWCVVCGVVCVAWRVCALLCVLRVVCVTFDPSLMVLQRIDRETSHLTDALSECISQQRGFTYTQRSKTCSTNIHTNPCVTSRAPSVIPTRACVSCTCAVRT